MAKVQELYEAFGKGDVPSILSSLADDVDWDYGHGSTDVPWLQPRSGREAAGGFFEALMALDFHKFAPKEFLEAGNTVVALLDIDYTVKATGKRVNAEDEVHIWRFGSDGKVARFTHLVDTHAVQLAYKG
ncbi:MAG TPA: nuclear transport factor 2 family protein [Dehalococcoidia bacterium]|nr:nuclear transport factor 2 family protein [Dehalococcoidia bacterium]